MKTMIFAAGLGTRLKPLTDNLPKALAPVAGHTLLYYVLMRLHAAGSDEFVINIHHFADKIRAYVATDPELSRLDIRYSDETDLLRDTGGGIRYAESLLRSAEGRFLVHNVDIISDLQLDWFLSQARPGALATLLLSERVTKRYFLCDGDNRIVGWTNVATGEVKTPFHCLDVSHCHKAAFAGVHLVSDAIFDVFRDIDSSPSDNPLYDAAGNRIAQSEKPLGQCFSIVDAYLRAAARHPIYAVIPSHLTLIDAGKRETLAEAERYLTEA